MKKLVGLILIFAITLSGCGGGNVDIVLKEAPHYKDGVAYPIVLSVTEADEGIFGAEVMATLEMEKMDHGLIDIVFTDLGDGTYEGEVELSMAGEWIATVVVERDGKTYEEILTFDVKEG